MVLLGLCCCTWTSCASESYSLVAVCKLLIVVAFLVVELGL